MELEILRQEKQSPSCVRKFEIMSTIDCSWPDARQDMQRKGDIKERVWDKSVHSSVPVSVALLTTAFLAPAVTIVAVVPIPIFVPPPVLVVLRL